MPIYEYSCRSCNRTFSLLQKIGGTGKDTTCSNCGSSEVKKLVSAFCCSTQDTGYSAPPSGFPSGGA